MKNRSKKRSKSRTESVQPRTRIEMVDDTHKAMHKGINALILALCSPRRGDDANTKKMRRAIKKSLNLVKKGFDAMAMLAKEVK